MIERSCLSAQTRCLIVWAETKEVKEVGWESSDLSRSGSGGPRNDEGDYTLDE
jgi:hypothetical protein